MHDVVWHHEVDCVRSKDAQKQLARTSLRETEICLVPFQEYFGQRSLRQELLSLRIFTK